MDIQSSAGHSNKIILWAILLLGLWFANNTYRKNRQKEVAAQKAVDEALRLKKEQEKRGVAKAIADTQATGHNVLSSSFGAITNLDLASEFTMTFGSVNKTSPATQSINFSFNPKVKPVNFSQLLFFLSQRTGHQKNYILDQYDCKHFAHNLYEEAIAKGIKAHFVTISYVNQNIGHAITGFPTTDQGIVYVDFTPISTSNGFAKTQRLIWLEEGKNYLDIPVDQMWMGFENNFANFSEYHRKHKELDLDSKDFQNKVRHYQRLASAHKAQVDNFQKRVRKINDHNIAVSPEENEDLQAVKDEINQNAQEINELAQELKEEQNELIEDREHIGLPTSKRVVKSFELHPHY